MLKLTIALCIAALAAVSLACGGSAAPPDAPPPASATATPGAVPQETPAALPTFTPSREKDQFVAQLTKAAPTLTTSASLAPTTVAKTGQHEQWVLLAVSPTEQQKAQYGVAGSRTVNDEEGQQYTCGYYLDGTEVARVNLAFAGDLVYSVVENQYGELQGAVNASTSVDGVAIPLEWRTWASRADRIRLRDDQALRLVREIRERDATEFQLTLHDNQEMSKTYDVSDLIDAIAVNSMTCFTGQ